VENGDLGLGIRYGGFGGVFEQRSLPATKSLMITMMRMIKGHEPAHRKW
jgi:hypothetical protein